MSGFVQLVHGMRWIIQRLMTSRAHVPCAEKIIRGMALVPVFGILLIFVRVLTWLAGPLRVEALTRHGDRLACDLPDLIQMYIYLFGVWEPDLEAFIQSRLTHGDVFVDVGANVGFDTLVASRCVGSGDRGGLVIAVEASPRIYDRLLETLRLNGSPTNVKAINIAVAAERGTLEVYAGPRQNIGLTTTVRRGSMPRIAVVQAAPLAELIRDEDWQRIRMIKIDVEGGEAGILDGLARSIDRLPPAAEIAVELSPLWWSDRSRCARDVLQPFLDHGFHVYLIPNNYWPWRYLWPCDVHRPRRLRDEALLTRPMKRLDVILSRLNADRL